MKKPIILITGGPAYDRQFHSSSMMINKTYISAVVAAGGIPLMPMDMDNLDEYVDMADGCIFTGTHQFSPNPALSFKELQEERKDKEHVLMRKFVETGKPVLCICQGMQQLNVAYGGTLKYDFRLTEGVEHRYTEHTIDTVEGTLIHKLFGSGFFVNSIHTVCIDTLADEFKVSAYSPDGIIEAYEHKTLPVYAFQWHPERERGDFPDPPCGINTDPLFSWFVEMCRDGVES